MTVTREDLHDLVDALPDAQMPLAAEELRRLAMPVSYGPKAFAWIGNGQAKNGRTDNAQRVDELLTQGFER